MLLCMQADETTYLVEPERIHEHPGCGDVGGVRGFLFANGDILPRTARPRLKQPPLHRRLFRRLVFWKKGEAKVSLCLAIPS